MSATPRGRSRWLTQMAAVAALAALVVAAPVPAETARGSARPAGAGSSGSTCDPTVPATCSLRELADPAGVRVGANLDPDTLAIPEYTEVLRREHRTLTPENALKWYAVQDERGVFDFSGADGVVQFAEDHGLEVRGHTLVWAQDRFTPEWVRAIVDRDEMLAELELHLRTVMQRYQGRIDRWDVVNEPLETPLGAAGFGTEMGDNAYRRALGDRWIDEIFAIAHDADPDAELWLNEVATDYAPARHDALVALLRELLGRGVPIDGIGLQTHRFTPGGPDEDAFADQLRDFAALGLRVAITELDVATSPTDPDAFARQADAYGRIVRACLQVPACEEVTTWGITDALTWLDSDLFPFLAKPTRPLPFDDEYRPKPAYEAMRGALAAGRPATEPAPTPGPAPVPGPADPAPAPRPAQPVPGEASYTG